MLDPSNSQLGSGGGGSSMFNPDQFNTMKFNFFNPQSQSGGGGGGGSSGAGGGGSGGAGSSGSGGAGSSGSGGAGSSGSGGAGSGGSGGAGSSGSGGAGSSGSGGAGNSGSGGGSQLPKFDANKVNQLQSNMLDPSSSKLGTSGGAGGGFDPDQFNSKQFNFFNPQNQLGKRGKFFNIYHKKNIFLEIIYIVI